MAKLTFQSFITGTQDFETRQYEILHALRECRRDFSRNCLYPTLSDLIDLVESLEAFLEGKSTLEQKLPQELTDIDIEHQRLIFEPVAASDKDLQRVIDLIEWALPHLRNVIEEGMEIYDFVDSHLTIEEVGLLPVYRDEGYWFVPETRASKLHLLRYEVSLYTSANKRYRALKTRLLETLEQRLVRRPPESIKLDLIRKYHDLPTPATFMCETDLDFAYAETILPVGKRKLMARLFSAGQSSPSTA